MTDPILRPDLDTGDDTSVTRESTRGGQEPAPENNDRPDQNVAYDEAVKGAPLTEEERQRAERESPLSD
jgi:hypothetical protein